ncbi:MAG: hypothetical protein ACREAY_11740 [Nitrososphaera sp.]|uniref:hypothetical protein n=1 Tax=Nitrososphaera sp. TaxID=1971748 RepID=UPI003D700174
MFKVTALIVGGVFLMAAGFYALSVSNIQFPVIAWPEIDWPVINWAVVGFVILVGGLVSAGAGVIVSRMT